MKSITVAEIISSIPSLGLRTVMGSEFTDKLIKSPRVQRPGLALSGYFEHIRPNRVELFGETELNFMKSIEPSRRLSNLKTLAKINQSVFIVSKGLDIPPEVATAATQYSIPVLSSSQTTVQINNELEECLDLVLAPETNIHGVCVEVDGLGTVITGSSGIGKSECAIELIKRGHRLVADDVVTVKKVRTALIAESNERLRGFIELRGIGILDIVAMYGLPAVKKLKKIDLVVEFVDFSVWNTKGTDRLGVNGSSYTMLDITVPKYICPVSPGRNMAEIVELVVKNHILKREGYNSSIEFTNKTTAKTGKK